jgi:dihydroorotate dehydrogenase (fumarate)
MSVDLRTTYLGLELASPLVAAASPLSGTLDGLQRLEEAGASAIVLQSLFEEQIEHHQMQLHDLLEAGSDSFPEARHFFPGLDDYNTGPEPYLRLLEQAKSRVKVPLIASLNGVSRGGWTRYAKLLEDAGADALELNVYFVAADPTVTSAEVEERYLELVRDVAGAVSIPVAVKVGPYFTSLANMAVRLVGAGARGLVLFNRFLYPDISLERMKVVPTLHLSTSDEARLPLRWIAILRDRVDASLAASSGIHTAQDVLKMVAAGADVTMLASALLRRGPDYLHQVEGGVRGWLEANDYRSLSVLKGSMSQATSPNPGALERANYMRSLVDFTVGSPDPQNFYARRDPIPWD